MLLLLLLLLLVLLRWPGGLVACSSVGCAAPAAPLRPLACSDGHCRDSHVDVAPRGLGVGAEVVRERGQPVGGRLVHALDRGGDGHREAHAAVRQPEVDGGHGGAGAALDLVLARHELKCAVEAGAVAGGEELLGVGGATQAAVIGVLLELQAETAVGVW